MAINVSAANGQAAQLRGYADKLQQAKNQLINYKSSLTANWQGNEVGYMSRGIDKAVAQIDAAVRDIKAVANDVSNVAATIKREEDVAVAAARARAAKQRLEAAQKSYDNSKNELSKLEKQKEDMLKKLKGKSLSSAQKKQLDSLDGKIKAAQDKYNECKNALAAARG